MKSKTYWEKRQEKLEEKSYKKGTKAYKEYVKTLQAAKCNIERDISSLIAKYMQATNLSKQDALKLLKGNEYRKWRKDIAGYVKELNSIEDKDSIEFKKLTLEIETLAHRSRITRLDELNTQIQMELVRTANKNRTQLQMTLESVYKDTCSELAEDFGIKATIDFNRVKKVLNYKWSGKNYSERIWGDTDKLAQTIKAEVTQGLNQGINYKKMSKRISDKFNTSMKNAERLVRTEVSYVHNRATQDSYKDAGIEKYEYLATLDSRTSQVCANLNGMKFNVKNAIVGINYPPMHPRCRSTTIPIIEF